MIELNKIYNEDCLEGMKRISDSSVDMILCDLPYGTTQNKWDVIIPFDKLWGQYERIIKDNGAIVLTASQPFTTDVISSNRKLFRYEWIWQKDNATGFLTAKTIPMKIHESVIVFYKATPEYHPQMRDGFEPYKTFHGSGTTAIACINTERNFIGFETNEEYYDKSLQRIKNNVTQLDLFEVEG